MRLGRTGDGNHVTVARQQPVQGDLADADVVRAGNIGETRQQRFRAHAVRRLREAPGRKGKLRDQCHIELTAGFEHAICFRCSSEQAVVDLIGGEGHTCPCEVIGAVKSGKARAVGVANFNADQMRRIELIS
jgi:hypothetical protein